MIAHYELVGDSYTPRLHTIGLSLGVASRAKDDFHVIGSGSDLAHYLLTDLGVQSANVQLASAFAVYVVEIVKRHDPYCGGPVKLGIVNKPAPDSPSDVAIHPYTAAVGYGKQVRFSTPWNVIAAEMDQQTEKTKALNQ